MRLAMHKSPVLSSHHRLRRVEQLKKLWRHLMSPVKDIFYGLYQLVKPVEFVQKVDPKKQAQNVEGHKPYELSLIHI